MPAEATLIVGGGLAAAILLLVWWFTNRRRYPSARLSDADRELSQLAATAPLPIHPAPAPIVLPADTEAESIRPVAPGPVDETVMIEYSDANGRFSRRRISVRRIETGQPWGYVMAWCHERTAWRSFRTDRIQAVIDIETGEVSSIDDWLRTRQPSSQVAIRSQTPAVARPVDGRAERQLLVREAANRHAAALQVLVFLGRADGQFRKAEKAIAAEFLARRAPITAEAGAEAEAFIGRMRVDAESFRHALKSLDWHDAPLIGDMADTLSAMIDADGVAHPGELEVAGVFIRAAKRRSGVG